MCSDFMGDLWHSQTQTVWARPYTLFKHSSELINQTQVIISLILRQISMPGHVKHPLNPNFYADSISTDDKWRVQEVHLASELCIQYQESYF